MKIVELIRLEESETAGTIGVLKVDKKVMFYTLEPPDRENESGRSSIPAQQYIAKYRESPKHGPTFTVSNVPGRTWINFHPGRIVDNTEGCILLGGAIKRTGKDLETVYLEGSDAAFCEFMKLMEGEEKFHLTIKEEY